jgi:hypothetical protein
MFFKNSIFGEKIKIFIKNGILGSAFYENYEPPWPQGPQKKFGGPHEARGPHFGHVCDITSTTLFFCFKVFYCSLFIVHLNNIIEQT